MMRKDLKTPLLTPPNLQSVSPRGPSWESSQPHLSPVLEIGCKPLSDLVATPLLIASASTHFAPRSAVLAPPALKDVSVEKSTPPTIALNPNSALLGKESLQNRPLDRTRKILSDAYDKNPAMTWQDAEALMRKDFSYGVNGAEQARDNMLMTSIVYDARLLSEAAGEKATRYIPQVLQNMLALAANSQLLPKLVNPPASGKGKPAEVSFAASDVTTTTLRSSQSSHFSIDLLNLSKKECSTLYHHLEKPTLFPENIASITLDAQS